MEKRPLLLRVDLAVGLAYYVARGRPLIQPSKLPKTPLSWDTIIEKTWTDEDLHVPKVVRALKIIAVECGEMDEELARNAAGLVVQEKVVNGRTWSMLGHGFDEAWEEVSKEN
jgi:Questin oxidase-like